MTFTISQHRRPPWLPLAATLGLAWNIFGLVQFTGSLLRSEASLIESGLDADQAAVMMGYPAWMTVAFAVGVISGTLGSALLLLRKKLAVPVLAASLAGYILLYIGDILYGVFAALGAPQIIVLTLVVVIAAALLWGSLEARARLILT